MWLVRMARFWNGLLRRPVSSLERQALDASLELAALRPAGDSPWAPWAAQVAAAMRAAGVAFDPTQRQPLSPQRVQHDAVARYLQRIAAETASHTLLRRYFEEARGGSLTADSYGPAPYVQEVRRRALRQPVTQLSAGVHWGAEDTGRLRGVARRDRLCPHCAGLGGPGGIESVHHILFECPLYAEARARYPQLCFAGPPTLHKFLYHQPPLPLARFAADCYHIHRSASAAAPAPTAAAVQH